MKWAKVTSTGDAVATPCVVYYVVVAGTAAGANAIIQDSATEKIRIYIPANTTYSLDLNTCPLLCATKCTVTITAGGGTLEVAVGYQDWAL